MTMTTIIATGVIAGRNKKPNRTGRTEPNRLISETAGTERGPEPNRTEPRRVQKAQAEPHRTATKCQIEPNRNNDFSNNTEPKQIEPNRFLPVIVI